MWDMIQMPCHGLHCIKRASRAQHNAFKTIAAVMGGSPKDVRRFFAKLEAIGVDPAEQVVYVHKSSISAVIRRMNDAHDKRSAQGSTRRRTIRPAELSEFQALRKNRLGHAQQSSRVRPRLT